MEDSIDAQDDPSSESTESTVTELDESCSVYERRPYERVRGKQWFNTQLARQRRFRKERIRATRKSASMSP